MSRQGLALEQIVFARNYTLGLLDQTPTAEWFGQPPVGVSHVAWQVGHVAFSEYRLRPHGLQHAGITAVLTRHDDNRQDLAGDVARLVASG
jgi:hypothetical protein